MKKTLVALAALAATGAFAQVTITGNLAMGYQQVAGVSTTNGGPGDYSGLGVDTSEIDFAATEDLGGGWKVEAKMALAGADRSNESGTSVKGRNATLTLTTPVGAVVLGSVKAADYLSGGTAGVGALYYNMAELDGAAGLTAGLFSARSSRDTLSYVLPMGGFTFGLSHQEGANVQGLGTGAAGTAVAAPAGQRLTAYSVKYAAGALVADAALLQFDQSAGAGSAKDEQRLSASYDLGVAKLGAGIQITNYQGAANAANPKKTQTLVGVNVPMGAASLGLNLGNRKSDDFAVSGSQSGYALAVTYNLSKRTAVIGQYSNWESAVNTPTRTAATAVLLSHSF